MDTTEINWGYNCLTSGVHHGRPEKLWNLPLVQTQYMFTPVQLQQLVVDRIYNDALQNVEHGTGYSQEWAEKVKALAGPKVLEVYQRKIGEIIKYYNSSMFKDDVERVIERNKMGKLNSHYQPLHDHDTINLLCRIVGVGCDMEARTTTES